MGAEMNCIDCYKYRLCWYCAKVFGCSKPSQEDGCFHCDKIGCPKEKEAANEQ